MRMESKTRYIRLTQRTETRVYFGQYEDVRFNIPD